MAKYGPIKVDVLNTEKMARFIRTIQEIAGTTNDPDTATNLRAALDTLYGRNSND